MPAARFTRQYALARGLVNVTRDAGGSLTPPAAAGAAGAGGRSGCSVAAGGGRGGGRNLCKRKRPRPASSLPPLDPYSPKPSPTATVAPARGGGLQGKGLLCNKRGTERVAGEGIVALRGRDGVGRMGLFLIRDLLHPANATERGREGEEVVLCVCPRGCAWVCVRACLQVAAAAAAGTGAGDAGLQPPPRL